MSSDACSSPHAPSTPIALLEDGALYQYEHLESCQHRQNHGQVMTPGTVSNRGASVAPFQGLQTSANVDLHPHHPTKREGCPLSACHDNSSSASTDALRPGGQVDLFASANVGLLVNYFAVGIFNGVFPALVYPLFKIYLSLEGYQSNAASSLLSFAWYLKFPLGFVSDSFPINGYRRKPYIYLGWMLVGVVMAWLAFRPVIEPYERDGAVVNPHAQAAGPNYVIPLMIASIGYLLADVACDGLMVEYAQREGAEVRGQAQTMVYGVRFLAELLGTLIVALGLNSRDYGGDFAEALSLPALFGGLAVVGLATLIVTRFHLQDERVIGQPVRHYVRGVWRVLRHRATWQITIYGFLQFFTLAFDVSPANTLQQVWLHMDPLTKSLSYCVNSGVYALATYIMRHCLLNTSWRAIMVVAVLGGVLGGLPIVLVTVFDVYRNQYLYLLKEQLMGFFDALAMMVRLVLIIEIAEPGLESTTYSLITTVNNLAVPVMTATSNVIGTTFDVYDADLVRDTTAVRWHVAASFLVMFGLRLVVNAALLPLLPRQKAHARELKRHGSSNPLLGALLFGAFGCIFVASLVANLLSIFATTACLRFAGGDGC